MEDSNSIAASNGRVARTFPEISSRAFEHPLDRTALTALQKLKGFDWVVRKFLNAIGERRLRLLFLASAVRVDETQFPRVNTLLKEACDILDIAPPELFITRDFVANAAAVGVDRPFVVITSSLLEVLDDDELRCVIGHELGHILCGHALYTTVALLFMRLWVVFIGLPGGAVAGLALLFALMEWRRKAELSADRAGLLVAQDVSVCQRLQMKLAGGRRADEMNIEGFRKQAKEFEGSGDLIDGVLKLSMILKESHPFPVFRIQEIDKWAESAHYAEILSGTYPKRSDDETPPWREDVKAAAANYGAAFAASADPFVSAVRDLKSSIISTGSGLVDQVFRKKK